MIFVLTCILQVSVACIVVWVINYLQALNLTSTLSNELRTDILIRTHTVVQSQLALPIRAIHQAQEMTELALGDKLYATGEDATALLQSDGFLAALSFVLALCPLLPGVGFATSGGLLVSAFNSYHNYRVPNNVVYAVSDGSTWNATTMGDDNSTMLDVPSADVLFYHYLRPNGDRGFWPRSSTQGETSGVGDGLRSTDQSTSITDMGISEHKNDDGTSAMLQPDFTFTQSASSIMNALQHPPFRRLDSYTPRESRWFSGALALGGAVGYTRTANPSLQQDIVTISAVKASFPNHTRGSNETASPSPSLDPSQPAAVFFATQYVSTLSDYLSRFDYGESGFVCVVERNGLVIAASHPLHGGVRVEMDGGKNNATNHDTEWRQKRTWIHATTDPFLQAIVQPLLAANLVELTFNVSSGVTPTDAVAPTIRRELDNEIDPPYNGHGPCSQAPVNSGLRCMVSDYPVDIDGSSYRMQAAPVSVPGVSWSIVVLTRESDFSAGLVNTTLLSFAVLVASVILTLFLTHFITKPIIRIQRFMDTVVQLVMSNERSPDQTAAALAQSKALDGDSEAMVKQSPQTDAARQKEQLDRFATLCEQWADSRAKHGHKSNSWLPPSATVSMRPSSNTSATSRPSHIVRSSTPMGDATHWPTHIELDVVDSQAPSSHFTSQSKRNSSMTPATLGPLVQMTPIGSAASSAQNTPNISSRAIIQQQQQPLPRGGSPPPAGSPSTASAHKEGSTMGMTPSSRLLSSQTTLTPTDALPANSPLTRTQQRQQQQQSSHYPDPHQQLHDTSHVQEEDMNDRLSSCCMTISRHRQIEEMARQQEESEYMQALTSAGIVPSSIGDVPRPPPPSTSSSSSSSSYSSSSSRPRSHSSSSSGSSSSSSSSSSRSLQSCAHSPCCFSPLPLISFAELDRMSQSFESMLYSLLRSQLASHQASASKKRFIRYIFHEVRVPFSAVVLGVEQIKRAVKGSGRERERDRDQDRDKEHAHGHGHHSFRRRALQNCLTELMPDFLDTLDLIEEQSKCTLRVLNDVLNLQRLEESALQLEYAPFNLARFVHHTLKSFIPSMREKNLKCKIIWQDGEEEEQLLPPCQPSPTHSTCAHSPVTVGDHTVENFIHSIHHQYLRDKLGAHNDTAERERDKQLKRHQHDRRMRESGVDAAFDDARPTDLRQVQIIQMDDQKSNAADAAHSTTSPNAAQITDTATAMPATMSSLSSLSSQAMGDRYRLRQCFSNFVSNSVKFSPTAGSILVRVDMRLDQCKVDRGEMKMKLGMPIQTHPSLSPSPSAAQDDVKDPDRHGNTVAATAAPSSTTRPLVVASSSIPSLVRISVTDTGSGMSPMEVASLWNDFVQFHPNQNQKGGGSGLGLNIARRLIELHGGQIWCKSEKGVGSTFTMEVPLLIQTINHACMGSAGMKGKRRHGMADGDSTHADHVLPYRNEDDDNEDENDDDGDFNDASTSSSEHSPESHHQLHHQLHLRHVSTGSTAVEGSLLSIVPEGASPQPGPASPDSLGAFPPSYPTMSGTPASRTADEQLSVNSQQHTVDRNGMVTRKDVLSSTTGASTPVPVPVPTSSASRPPFVPVINLPLHPSSSSSPIDDDSSFDVRFHADTDTPLLPPPSALPNVRHPIPPGQQPQLLPLPSTLMTPPAHTDTHAYVSGENMDEARRPSSGPNTPTGSSSATTSTTMPIPSSHSSLALAHLQCARSIPSSTPPTLGRDSLMATSTIRTRGRILVVEDNAACRKLLIRLVRSLGYEVEGVENGVECLVKCGWSREEIAEVLEELDGEVAKPATHRRQASDTGTSSSTSSASSSSQLPVCPYSVILLDGEMPLLNGYDATRHLRARGLSIPIIACTANALRDDVDIFLSSGASDVLTKPISRKQLVNVLSKHLPTHNTHSASGQPGNGMHRSHSSLHGTRSHTSTPYSGSRTIQLPSRSIQQHRSANTSWQSASNTSYPEMLDERRSRNGMDSV